jgi:hypothetical protein
MQGPNPMARIAQAMKSSPALREAMWRDPRAVIESLTTAPPADVRFDLQRREDGRAYFTSSIPKARSESRHLQQMKSCPVAQISGEELMADPVGSLGRFGIRVPEDVDVTWDEAPDGYLHFTVVLDE